MSEKNMYFIPRQKLELFAKNCRKHGAYYKDITDQTCLYDLIGQYMHPDHSELVYKGYIKHNEKMDRYAVDCFVNDKAAEIKEEYMICEIYADQSWSDFCLLGAAKKEDDGVNYYTFVSPDDFSFKDREVNFKHCDGCGKSIDRKSTYYIKDIEKNKLLQMGGTCAKNLDIETRLSALHESIFQSIDGIGFEPDDCFANGKKDPFIDPNIAQIAGWILDKGYLSKTKARDEYFPPVLSTSEEIQLERFNVEHKHDHLAQVYLKECFNRGQDWIEEKQIDPIDELIGHWREKLQNSSVNDFEFCNNMLNAVNNPTDKKFGLITYAVYDLLNRYNAFESKEITKPEKPLDLPAGKTQDIPGEWTIWSEKHYEDQWGIKALVKCVNDKLEGLQFYISPDKLECFDIGSKVKIRAGIKGLNSRQDTLVLTRVKLMSV